MSFSIYRKASDTGFGTKDWAIKVESNKLVIMYGKTDKMIRTTEIPELSCKTSLSSEASKRISDKQKEGYEYVCDGEIHKGKIVLPKPDEDKRLFWSINVSDIKDDELDSLYKQAFRFALSMKDCVNAQMQDSDQTFNLKKNGQLFLSFGVLDEGIESDRISRELKKGNGQTSQTILPEYQILFFLALAKQYPALALANKEGHIIEPDYHNCPLLPSFKSEEMDLLAEDLNLIRASICYHRIAEASTTVSWFS